MRILIILVCLFVVLLTAITIIVGSRTFDGVVVANPYETGLAWDSDERQRTELGWTVSIAGGRFHTGRNDLFLAVSGRDRRSVPDARVNVRVTRPSTTSFDRTYRAEKQPDGRFLTPIELPRQGTWDLIVTVQKGDVHADYTLHLSAERTDQ